VGFSVGLARPSAATPYEEAVVVRVIDGDTIELEDGRRVRYIGIDTPETVHPEKEVKKPSQLKLCDPPMEFAAQCEGYSDWSSDVVDVFQTLGTLE